jgi:DNA gyrase inhibitor GyrI
MKLGQLAAKKEGREDAKTFGQTTEKDQTAINCNLGSWLPTSGRKGRKAPSFLVAVNAPESMPPAFGVTYIFVPLQGGK